MSEPERENVMDEEWARIESWLAVPGHPDGGLYELRVGRWGPAPDYWAEAWLPDISPDGPTHGIQERGDTPTAALRALWDRLRGGK